MYSLYKAWLTRDHRPPLDRLDHRQVLVTAGTGPNSRQFTAHREVLAEHSGYLKSLLNGCPTDEIAVPNIAPEVFGPLLAYMYTGYLDLNGENIYAVLLAGHLLHMPRAVDLCRGFLLRRQCPGLLVKPIPSRKYPPCGTAIYWPPPPVVPSIVPPPFRPPSYPPPVLLPPPPTDPVASTSAVEPHPRTLSPSPPPRVSPASSPTSDSSGDATVTVTVSDPPRSRETPTKRQERRTVTDVACCDGPVRFRRVLNANYGVPSDDTDRPHPSAAEEEKRPVFVCHFCKHTFKSHYCYRKHTRRHINPVGAPLQEDRSASLHLNVQYYPCKTCGSKFPSYYFVHKHRKLCHPDETNQAESTPTTTASTPS